MKSIHINEIPKNLQPYDTVGNYFEGKQSFIIDVSKEKGYVNDEDELMGVALHELVELLLCNKRKIKIKDIDAWDLNFKGKGEPGESKGAPYFKEHAFANKLEALFIKELKKYDRRRR